jgi:PilZ domain-containing protein
MPMPENLSVMAATRLALVSEKRAERRQIRRAGIALQARVRSADSNDGCFDEMQMTQNASRKAIYFFTGLNRYYKGMRVRVTCPYDPNAREANLEQIGEVVRVHRRADGYGVAVAMPVKGQTASAEFAGASGSAVSEGAQATAIGNNRTTERRCATRMPFVAPVEMVETQTGSRIKARTSDLSPQGCYVDTLNPLPVGASVRLQIYRAGLILDAQATVSARHAGSGMGLVFGEFTSAQRAVLESWLSELGMPGTAFTDLFSVGNGTSGHEPDCAERLVRMLLRKGVISQAEAKEVLNGRGIEGQGPRAFPDAL